MDHGNVHHKAKMAVLSKLLKFASDEMGEGMKSQLPRGDESQREHLALRAEDKGGDGDTDDLVSGPSDYDDGSDELPEPDDNESKDKNSDEFKLRTLAKRRR